MMRRLLCWLGWHDAACYHRLEDTEGNVLPPPEGARVVSKPIEELRMKCGHEIERLGYACLDCQVQRDAECKADIARAVEAEREACATLAEDWKNTDQWPAAAQIMINIRARGERR